MSGSPADLNNVEATQGEVKLEVAGRWTGHNTGTELSGCVYFHASKTSATDRRRWRFCHRRMSVVRDGEGAMAKRAFVRCPQVTHVEPGKTRVMRNPFPGTITGSRPIESQTFYRMWYWSKSSPAFLSWRVTDLPCGLGQGANLSGPCFPHCKMNELTSRFLPTVLSPFCFFGDSENVYFWNPHLKWNQCHHPVSNQLTDVKGRELERQMVNNWHLEHNFFECRTASQRHSNAILRIGKLLIFQHILPQVISLLLCQSWELKQHFRASRPLLYRLIRIAWEQRK